MRPVLKGHVGDYEFSIGYRLTHWIRFFAIIILIVSGFYLSYVFQSPNITSEPTNFLNAKWRFIHIVFGFIMIGVAIFKTYLFLTDPLSRKELVAIYNCLDPRIWVKQIGYYLFICNEHPRIKGTYNPLQFVSYFFFYIILFVISVTGMILYVHVYHDGLGGIFYDICREIEILCGGLANVREIHHICMWLMMIFIPIHVYMAIFNAVKGVDGCMDAIISGYKFPKENHK